MADKTQGSVDLSDQDHIEWDLKQKQTYGDYLDLDHLLAAQHPRTQEHDEMLFIIIHQTMELWMKLAIHELHGAIAHVAGDDLSPAMKMLARVGRMQSQMLQSWEILSTMTPADYLKFRPGLGPASGFQSHQYRILEFMLGNKNAHMTRVHEPHATRYQAVMHALSSPSIYDEAIRLLARRGFAIDGDVTDRDWSQPHRANASVEAAWNAVYSDTKTHWDLYDLAEKLVDMEYRFQQWRFAHMKTVERIIGFKRGTGGTTGVDYLGRALSLKFFPELWSVRTAL